MATITPEELDCGERALRAWVGPGVGVAGRGVGVAWCGLDGGWAWCGRGQVCGRGGVTRACGGYDTPPRLVLPAGWAWPVVGVVGVS